MSCVARQTQSINLFLHSFSYSSINQFSLMAGSVSWRTRREEWTRKMKWKMAEEPAGMEFFRVRGPPAITHPFNKRSQPNKFHEFHFTQFISFVFASFDEMAGREATQLQSHQQARHSINQFIHYIHSLIHFHCLLIGLLLEEKLVD